MTIEGVISATTIKNKKNTAMVFIEIQKNNLRDQERGYSSLGFDDVQVVLPKIQLR